MDLLGQRHGVGAAQTTSHSSGQWFFPYLDFLGFTHICSAKRRSRTFLVKRQTISKRLRSKLREIRATLLHRRHQPIPVTGRWLGSVLRGYYNYHAVPGNIAALETVHRESLRSWLFALRRRSQRHRMTWDRLGRLAGRWIPHPKILHPHPNERFYAKHPK